MPLYSTIEHVARIACPSDWRRVDFVMLTTAFDISEDHPATMVILAGFISSAERWGEFDIKWRERLKADGLTYFHMHAYAHSLKEFKGWRDDRARRDRLMADLLALISEHAFRKFGIVVEMAATDAMYARTVPTTKHKAIRIATSAIVGDVESWKQRDRCGANPTEYVFEDGEKGKGKGAIIAAIKGAVGKEPIFRAKRDDPKKKVIAFTPLHAADMLAFELKKQAEFERDSGKKLQPGYKFRFPMEEFHRMPGEASVFNENSVKALEPLTTMGYHFERNPLI